MQFHLREVLSITTGIVMRNRDETPGEAPFDCVYKVCDFMRRHEHDTIELLVAADSCCKEIYRQHEWLRNVSQTVRDQIKLMRDNAPDEADFQQRLTAYFAELDATYPDPVDLYPIPPDDNHLIPGSLEILRGINPTAVVFRLDGITGDVEEVTEDGESLF